MTRREQSALDDFSVDLNRLIRKNSLKRVEAVRKVVIDLHGGITVKNPVLTGRSRAGWNISEVSPDRSQPGPFPENPSAPSPPSATTTAIKQQQSRVSSFSGDEKIYITNSLPYIPPLENGHSGQAPQGMVNLTMAEVAAGIEFASQ